jgi:hypothetical protein
MSNENELDYTDSDDGNIDHLAVAKLKTRVRVDSQSVRERPSQIVKVSVVLYLRPFM